MQGCTLRQQKAYRLVYCEGLSTSEAARELKISRRAVNQLLKRLTTKYPSLQTTRINKPEKGGINHPLSLSEIDETEIREKW